MIHVGHGRRLTSRCVWKSKRASPDGGLGKTFVEFPEADLPISRMFWIWQLGHQVGVSEPKALMNFGFMCSIRGPGDRKR